jgi:hypothetical protein
VEGGMNTAVKGSGLRVGDYNYEGDWNKEVDFKSLNMIISTESLEDCEKCDITGLISFLHPST